MAWSDEIVGPDVASAGLHISDCISRDATSQIDLEEALEASRYSSHPYSSLPKEWPPLAEVVDTRELPPVLIERYNASGGEGTALCGIFPQIRRAWASVDNTLFLWRFDKCDGQCPEYNGGEEAICAVGLVKSKQGIFIEAIQYLMVLATPVELILVGVCCTARVDGSDPYAEITLQPLPEYTIPSDGITMTCITCTDKGLIFLAGRDGHIYEMQYSTGSGWQKRCRMVCLTSGLGTLLSRWVLPNAFNFGAVDSITDMIVDNERHILYARTEDMKLQVFDLGPTGEGPFKRVAEEKNMTDPRDAQYGGTRSSTSRSVSRTTRPSIVCIAPLSTLESKCLHLVVVLSDGRRLYLSTASTGNRASQRPHRLKVVASRPSPPLGAGSGLTFGALSAAGRASAEDLSLQVETAFYLGGTTVLSESSTAMSSLLIVNKDSTVQPSPSGNLGMGSRGTRALRESVLSLPIEGRMLFIADILPHPEISAMMHSLYSDTEPCNFEELRESFETSAKLWAKGDISMQHILPRRRIVVFSTVGMTEIAFNRPVDILRRLLETNASRSVLEDFFNRFGAGEAAAMCLMLAARLLGFEENPLTNVIAEKAAEVFEDPRLVGMPQLDGSGALSNTRAPSGVFSMGQVVQEIEPVFSAAYEGLCLCSSRLLFPVWELPIVSIQGSPDGVIVCRLSSGALQVLESKFRALELFLRSRRDKRRGLYGYVASLGDHTGSILFGNDLNSTMGKQGAGRSLFGNQSRSSGTGADLTSNKRQRIPYNPDELPAMEVRAMECLRRLLRRSSEALFLLQLLSQHHIGRLVQGLDSYQRHKLVELTFNQFVCSDEGDQLAMRLISILIKYYIGPDGRGTVDEISSKLRDGCPSYFSESDYKYFLAVECLERASLNVNSEERENLAREAFNFLTTIPESADLNSVCKRFEDLRYYEAVVRLPLLKAQALNATGDALDKQVDTNAQENMLAQREQCFAIITNALHALKGECREFGPSVRFSGTGSILNKVLRDKYIRQIVQLSVHWPDRAFHEHLYGSMIELGLENELLEYGGSDLVSFLQNAGREPAQEVRIDGTLPVDHVESSMSSRRAKYLDLLARYYITKRQHFLAAHVLYMLAERRSIDGVGLTLEQRRQYLSSAVLQAKSARSNAGPSSKQSFIDDGLLDMLEAKLSVLRFQMKIKVELEAIAARLEAVPNVSSSSVDDSFAGHNTDSNAAKSARDKASELSVDLKSITQLYNDYAVPFQLWEVCLEILNFANYSGEADSKIVRETWARLIDQALSSGGIAEACAILKRVGSNLYPGDGAFIPLDALCLHLEKAAQERLVSSTELVGDEDVPRALLATCKDAAEPVLKVYDQLLSTGAVLPSHNLRLRLLRSALTVLREWSMSALAQKMDTSNLFPLHVIGSIIPPMDQATGVSNKGVRDKITSAANRYMAEVRRLALPQSQTDAVYRGFRELEEQLLNPYYCEPF